MVRDILILIEVSPESLSRIEAAGFKAQVALSAQDRTAAIKSLGAHLEVVLTNGSTGLSAAQIAALPELKLICALGAGYEKIDLGAAHARGIVVTHGPGTNDSSVADHAIALLMSIVRAIPQVDAAARRGQWAQSRQPRPTLSKKKLGILGLGNIGQQIARRAVGGFEMTVGYHSRHSRENSSFTYFDTPTALAAWADFLIVATPGGAGTFHLVDTNVLRALGPDGYLVNIARGSVVDTAALIEALNNHDIAGAALDVLEGEPEVPKALINLTNLILTPHIGGRSPEAVAATVGLVIDNLKAYFADGAVLTPVPRGE
ncbi:2-hydroxyacid dehydrogenase [Pseudomonas sp. N3-W]|uniref:2-hydroxyacid dehydrogenase n=1 Tax=Pseudomonas sp. N3-W TaxID=2975049 RepID=UPI00217E1DD2|nr:2-hydroxyacid dehydrogenase [Pseudomonas sp. N3-W]UWF51496.1 2-hydroxyacid dehydrogenase [Pseudomonas sp. N3-W]